jgi:predicted nucleotide-binding protein (sugar kinase/HSP70/actin superfamily)
MDWFSEMDMTLEEDNEGNPVTVLSGPVIDQAALNGLLNKIWNLNLTVLSVEQIDYLKEHNNDLHKSIIWSDSDIMAVHHRKSKV